MRWGPGTTIFKALALIVPWGVVEAAAGTHGDLGYAVGIFAGILCLYVVPPREKTLWRWLLIGLVMSLVHPVLRMLIERIWPKT
jgi:hypothetical protein